MLLAAMTWRNGHFLPESAPVEVMDSERDEWTYVVFYAALLHDIAKPVTDLRICWRYQGMADPIRWVPISGSLSQVAQGRRDSEYLVEFTPKSLRDYGAPGRLAITMLHQIATPTALTFLARRPHTMDALVQYLGGQDTTSLMASIVKRADKASTQRALLQGNKARFETAISVPLIELLMTAMRSMLKSGTALPLNRSGAAGWVYEGSVWFVAKRLADAVRAHLKQHAPDDAIPGDSKNDRLFDTWQEYGCIKLNPHSGQAVWYVLVQGGAEEGGEGYEHALTMLQFPLEKLFDNPQQYPPAMRGRIQVKDKRATTGTVGDDAESQSGTQDLQQPDKAVAVSHAVEGTQAVASSSEPGSKVSAVSTDGTPPKSRGKPTLLAPLKAPAFNKPKPAPVPAAVDQLFEAAATATPSVATATDAAPMPPKAMEQAAATTSSHAPAAEPETRRVSSAPISPHIAPPFGRFNDDLLGGMGFDDFLDVDDDVKVAAKMLPPSLPSEHPPGPKTPTISKGKTTAPTPSKLPQLPSESLEIATAQETASASPSPLARVEPMVRPLISRPVTTSRTRPGQVFPAAAPAAVPVVLLPQMPELPAQAGGKIVEPSETALAFMRWVQEGLVQRRIKYNETGAAVHFTAEGMALVSPVIFKLYARELDESQDADERGIQIQREVIKAGWHMLGPNKVNIVKYDVLGRGGSAVSKLSAVVLLGPDRWVMPVPPTNPVLKLL